MKFLKKFALLGTFLFLLASCNQTDSKKEEQSATEKTITVQEDKVIPVSTKDTIDYSYVWINKTYLTKLKKTGAHGKLWNKFKTLAIGLAPNETDLMLVNDENSGIGYTQKIKDQKLFLIPDQEEKYAKTLQVKWIEKGSSFRIDRDTLVKTKLQDFNRILETFQYQGEYLYNGKTVIFDGKGRIKNLGHFTSYRPFYGADNLDQENIVDLDVDSLHVAEFRGDTLNLYELVCEQRDEIGLDCIKGHKGKLKYKLIKKN